MKNKKSLIINLIWTFVYAMFTLMLVNHHEIWADEAQVWMIVKYLSLPELFKHLVNEGHPSFFYLLNMPFAKTGMSIYVMQIICWLSTVLSVFLLLQFSPFKKFTKFAIVTSAGFLYFLPVVARSYSLIPLFVFLLAMLYPKAKEKPYMYTLVLVLMANTHVIMYAFAALLALYFAYDYLIKDWKNLDSEQKKKFGIPFLIMVLGLLAVILQLSGTTSSNAFIQFDFMHLYGNTVKVFSEFFINCYDAHYANTATIMFSGFGILLIILSAVLYFMFFAVLFVNDKKLFALAFLSIGFQIAIYIVGYNHWIFITRIFCAHLILLFCFWVMLNNPDFVSKYKIFGRKFINVSLSLFFVFTLLNGLKYAVLDLNYGYSGAKETAEFIEKNIDKNNSILVSDNEPYTVSLAYYLDGKYDIYSARGERNVKYVVWDESLYHVLDGANWSKYVEYMKAQNPEFKNKKIYAVVSDFNMYKLNVVDIKDFKLIFKSKPAITKFEGFRIMEYKK